MIATVDIGNSNIVIGLMDENKKLDFCGRIRSLRDKNMEEFVIELKTLLDVYQKTMSGVEGVIISSVVPELTDTVSRGMALLTGKKPFVVGRGTKTGVSIATDHPASLGADLVVDAVAASEEYSGPVIIFDMGTATTCSVVDENKTYLGTLIIPGISISLDALSSKASQLPYIHLEKPRHLVGKNTIESMQSGILYGNAAMLDGLIDRIEAEYGRSMTVVATGGIAGNIVPLCIHKIHYDPDLLLKGLWYIYQKNNK